MTIRTVDTRDFNDFLNLIDLVNEMIDDRQTILQVAEEMERRIDHQTGAAWDWIIDHYYPPPRKGKVRWTSAKQRRWFWWAVSKGLIRVPYKRTHKLLFATDSEPIDIRPDGFTLALTVDLKKAPYGPYVVGLKQQGFHRDTGWPQLQEIPRQAGFVAAFGNESADIYVQTLQGRIYGSAL